MLVLQLSLLDILHIVNCEMNNGFLDYLNNSDIDDESDMPNFSDSSDYSDYDDSDTEQLIDSNEWISVTPSNDRTSTTHLFTANSGPKCTDTTNGTPDVLDMGNIFITETLISMLANFTNIRSRQNDSEMKPVTNAEMRKFIALTLYMGIVRKPRIRDYWSTSELLKTPIFHDSTALSRDRYFHILRYLRFADYNQEFDLTTDPLSKMRPFIDEVLRICKGNYLPSKEISVDETLMLYKGRLIFKQYIPSKRSRYGIKTFALCDSSNGYFWNFITYVSSKKMDFDVPNDMRERLSFTEKVVIHLTGPLHGLHYHLTTDNFFISLQLGEFLYQHGMTLTGTWRSNRGIPHALKTKLVSPNEAAFMRKGNVLAVKWVEKKSSSKKEVYLLDTEGKAELQTKVRHRKGGQQEEVRKPTSICKYNSFMGGIDRNDGLVERYDPTRKSLNWMSKYGIHLLHRLLLNSHIVYRCVGGNLSFLDYSLKYIELTLNSTGTGRSSLLPTTRPTKVGHLPKRIPSTTKKLNPTRKCRECAKNSVRRESRYICENCPTSPALCVSPCFKKYHEKR